jgi:hypothetical protein
LLLCSLLFSGLNFAQTEDQLKLEADKLFYAGKYLDASPLYVRLLSLNPRSYDYNFRYGACLLYQSNRKLESLKYLRNAALNTSGLPPEFHYFYGKSLHLSYLFNDAIKEYKLYNQQRLKETPVFDADRSILECENGKRLMTTITDIIVTDKKEISIDKFFRIYDLSNIGGSLLVTAEFQSKVDKKNNHIPLIHFPANPTVIYYSSYGDRGENGKDIYVRRKLPDNSWGQPQALPGEVNTTFDEDFPYMHPDGDYLYFSSKGHNTMGGYDVFRSKYNKETNSFGKPENMDFAISSPDDDVFYVVDSLNKDAVFASSRQSQEGFLHVYKVKVDRVPIQMAVVKGQFLSSIDTTIKKIDFTIRDYSNGDFIGKFNSNENGGYLITFPKGGKYEFVMTVNDSPDEFRSIVTIPFMKEFKPLKQQIQHLNENGIVNVKVVNQFDQPVDEPATVLAEVVQKRGELNVNVQEFDMAKIEAQKTSNSVLKDLGMDKLNMIEVSYTLQDQIKKGLDNKAGADKLNSNINNLIVENTADFLRLEEQIKEKVAASGNTTDAEQKYKLLKEAQLLMEEQKELKDYSGDLSRLKDSINLVMAGATSIRDIDKLKQLSGEFDKLVSQGDQEAALSLLSSNRILVQGVLRDTTADLMGNLVDQAVRYDNQIVYLNGRVDAFNRDIKELQLQIQTLNNSLNSAKGKEVDEIKSKIASKEEEVMLIQEERDLVQKSIDKLRQEKFIITEQMELLKDAISNKSLVAVSEERSKEAIKSTEKTNTNTLNSFVEQQVASIEKNDPSIKSRVVVVNNLSAQNIYQEFKSSDQGIKDDPNLNAEDRLYKQLSNERKALRMINKRLEDLTKLEKTTGLSSEQQAERQQLLNYQRELTALVQQHELDIRTVVSSDVVAKNDPKNTSNSTTSSPQSTSRTYTPQDVIAQADPGYAGRKEAVNKDVKLNEQQKLDALNKEDQRMLTAVNSDLSRVEQQLSSNPNDSSLKSQRDALVQAKTNTEQTIASRNDQIASNKQAAIAQNNAGSNTATGPQSRITATNQTELVAQLDPEYTNRTEKITSNQGMTPEQKVAYLNAQDTKLITAADAELKKVQADLAANPSDPKSVQKQTLLTNLKSTTQSAIDERNKDLAANDQLATNTQGKTTETPVNENKTASGQNGQTAGQNVSNPTNQQSADQLAANAQGKTTDTPVSENKTASGQNGQTAGQNVTNATNQQSADQLAANAQGKTTDTPVSENKVASGKNGQTAGQNVSNATNQQSADQLAANAQGKTTDTPISENKTASGQTAGQNVTNATNQQSADQIAASAQGKTTDTPESENKTASGQNGQTAGQNVTNATNQQNSDQLAANAQGKTTDTPESENKTASGQNGQTAGQNVTNQQSADQLAANAQGKTTDTPVSENKTASGQTAGQNVSNVTNQQSADQLAANAQGKTTDTPVSENKAASGQNGQTAGQNVNKTEQEQSALISKVAPTYASQMASIEANTSYSETEKLIRSQQTEKDLIASIDVRIAELNKEIARKPQDENLKSEKAALLSVKSETEARYDEREQLIASKVRSEMTEEQMSAQKVSTLEKAAPEYQSQLAESRKDNIESVAERKKELTIEENLSVKLAQQAEVVRKQLENQPSDKTLLEQQQVVAQLIKENEERKSELKEDIAKLEKGQPLISVNDADLNEELNSLDPEYKTKKQEIASSTLTEEERNEKLLEQEKDLALVLNARKNLVAAELKSNPTDKELKKELKVLDQLLSQNEQQISALEGSATKAPIALTSEQEQRLTEKVDSDHKAEVASISNRKDLTEEQKLDALQTSDEKLLSKIYDRMEQIDSEQQLKGNKSELSEERRQLSALSRTVETRLNERSAELDSKLSAQASTEFAKQSEINNLDASYQARKVQLENDPGMTPEAKKEALRMEITILQEKTATAILAVEKQLDEKGILEDRKRLMTLKAVASDLENELSSLSEPLALTKEERSKLITEMDRTYETEVQSIEQNSGLSEYRKQELLQQKESRLLSSVQAESSSVKTKLSNDPGNKVLQSKQQQLVALENSLQEQIAERRAFLSSPEAKQHEADKQEVLTSLQKDYSVKKNELQDSRMEEGLKTSEQLKLEKGILSKLETEQTKVERSLAKSPQDVALKQKAQLLDELIGEEKALIGQLENKQTAIAANAERSKVLSTSDASYESDMSALRSKGSDPNVLEQQLNREEIHAQKLNEQLRQNETALQKKNDPNLVKQNEILKTELAASEERNQQLRSQIAGEPASAAKTTYISDLRSQQLKENSSVVEATYMTRVELEDQDRQLAQYENYLNTAISQQEQKVAASPQDAKAKEELNWLLSERANVQSKRRSVKISLGELEKLEVLADNSSQRSVDSPELRKLDQEETQLVAKLEQTDLSKKERKQTEQQLTAVQQQQQKEEQQLLTKELAKEEAVSQDLAKQVANNSGQTESTTLTNKIATLQKQSDDAELAELNKKAAATKDPQEKSFLLNESLKKQEASNDRLKDAMLESQMAIAQKESGASSLETVEELEGKKRRYMIQIGELTKVIQELDAQIAETKPKAATALIAERNAKMEEQEAVKRQLAIVEQRITVQLAAEKRVETITKSASDQQVSYQEEREIASSESYKRYVEKAIPALELEKQIATLEAQLQEARSESRALTAKAVADPTQENKLNVQQHAQQVAQLEKQLATSKQELLAKQQLANAELPSNGTEAMKWQNLLKRGVEPVQRAAIIAALVPMPANGLEINKTAVATNMSKPIPVDVKSPTGLVYRVQVGAFSKPIPQDRFREFNPVSGETLDNGITRYMAGYFNSANSVTDARNKIRAIGYKDAFAIAYCDGKRISLAEAKALEASGRCVPKGENELIMEMAANTAVNLGITVSDSVLPALPEVDYNMVPGGVKSEPVEKHPGLFFTVQVGVFNNPVNAKVVNVMQPLISNRLPNGQIRYSSGMFASIEEARPKKQEAIDKGIKDAFITAYYKSQRITLAEAEQLLTQNGAAVLEANRISEVTEDNSEQNAKAVSTIQTNTESTPKSEVKIDPALITPVVKLEQKVQIVTKKTFDEFPREVLNRYNSHGSFYYDEQDKRVKSAVANSKESLPQVYYFKDDVDTVIVEQPNVINVKDVRIDFVGSSIPGDFTDWLLRYNYRREFKRSEGNTILKIYAIPEEKLDVLQGKLGEFGLTGTVE